MKLLARLKLAHKLLICSSLFLLPIAVLLYYAVSGFEAQIGFAAREMAGLTALQPLCRLAVILSRPHTDSSGATIDGLLAEIRKSETELGPLLPANTTGRSPDLSRQIYPALRRLGETANLILDPELDSYYLADMALLRVPAVYEVLSRAPAAPLPAEELERIASAVRPTGVPVAVFP